MLFWVVLMPAEYQFPFDLRHLAAFREVARRLHFRQAAEALSMAQPALSRQVARLEQAVGAALLERTRRRVELTAAGRRLLERIEPLLRAAAALTAEVQAVAAGREGVLRVQFTGLAMATVLPPVLRSFSRRFPKVRLELNESPTARQVAALKAGEIDCGFYHPDVPAPELQTRLLLRERNGVVLPADHARAPQGRGRSRALRLRDLGETPLVLFPRVHNPGFYDRILAACAAAGFTPKIAEEVWPRANGLGLVRAGLGFAFSTASEAGQLPAELVFRTLAGPAPESRLVLGWRRGTVSSPALEAFLSVALEAAVRPAAARSRARGS